MGTDESSKDRSKLRQGTDTTGSESPRPAQRSWLTSLLWAAIIAGVGVAMSAIINPILGREVHWEWMAGLAPASFVLVSWALRRRWV